MQYKNNTKQRSNTIQGLRSLKDTLPKNIKKVINNRGQVYSEILNNWKIIAGESLFKVCYPKSFKSSNKFSASTLLIMVQRGKEVDLEYSKKEIIDRMNNFFGKTVVEKIKFTSFDDEKRIINKEEKLNPSVTKDKFNNKIKNIKNDKIKKSLIELTKIFREK
tara:strand:- start:3855 stop:4343 length:489 start_codon:yes stop_codon:yes gene_type:complete